MKPAPFAYHAPETTAEAFDLLARFGDEAKALAGGQSLVPVLALRLGAFAHIVDLNRIPALRGVTAAGDGVRIGAMTTQSAVLTDHVARRGAPLLVDATRLIGHFQTRNRGTVGGSLAHADPAAEYPAAATALDATMRVGSVRGELTVPATEFFTGAMTTCLEPDELLLSVDVPTWGPRSGFAVEELSRRAGDFAVTGACCGVQVGPDGGVVRAAVVPLAMAPVARRATAAEAALVGLGHPPSDADLAEVAALAVAGAAPPDDAHADRRYRLRVGAVMVRRALRRAIDDVLARAEEETR